MPISTFKISSQTAPCQLAKNVAAQSSNMFGLLCLATMKESHFLTITTKKRRYFCQGPLSLLPWSHRATFILRQHPLEANRGDFCHCFVHWEKKAKFTPLVEFIVFWFALLYLTKKTYIQEKKQTLLTKIISSLIFRPTSIKG